MKGRFKKYMISQVIVLLILILLNAFFAMTEIAFISLNDAKISKQAKEGDKKAKQISKMLKNPSKFLATIQIGITLAGFLSSAFASDAFADRLAPVLEAWISLGIGVWKGISIVIITMILSYFTLVFGELVPKRVAMKNYEKVAYATITIIRVIAIITLSNRYGDQMDAIMNAFMDKVKILFENCLVWLIPVALLMTVVCFFVSVLIVKRKGRGVR